MEISEKRILTNIQLTTYQKISIAKIANAPTDKIAGEEVSNGRKMVAARDILIKLGLIDFNNGRATLTDKGTQTARDAGLVDDMDSLTDEGNKYAFAENGKIRESFAFLRDLNVSVSLLR